MTRTGCAALLALVSWLIAGCSPGIDVQAESFVPLVRSMADRLTIADQVALGKWDTGQPVHDPAQEAQFINNAVAMAADYALTAADAADVFSDQIEASREVQSALLDAWRRQGNAPATQRESVSGVIRPRLDRLQVSILRNLHGVAPLRGIADCRTLVAMAAGQVARQASFDALHLAALDRAAARVCVEPGFDVARAPLHGPARLAGNQHERGRGTPSGSPQMSAGISLSAAST